MRIIIFIIFMNSIISDMDTAVVASLPPFVRRLDTASVERMLAGAYCIPQACR